MSDNPPDRVPVESGAVGLSEVVKLLAGGHETERDPTSLAPTNGRVVEDAADGTVYIGDGGSWIDVEASLRQSVPGLDLTGDVNADGHDVKNAGAVEAESLTDGVAGDGNTIDSLAGGSQEVIPGPGYIYLPGESVSISNTSFGELGNQVDRTTTDLSYYDLTNSDPVVHICALVAVDAGETVTLRTHTGDAEVTGDENDNRIYSAWDTASEIDTAWRIEGKVSGGSATIERMAINFGREIK